MLTSSTFPRRSAADEQHLKLSSYLTIAQTISTNNKAGIEGIVHRFGKVR